MASPGLSEAETWGDEPWLPLPDRIVPDWDNPAWRGGPFHYFMVELAILEFKRVADKAKRKGLLDTMGKM